MLGQELWVSCGYVVGTEGLVVRLSRQQQTAFGAGAQPPAPQVGSHVYIVKRREKIVNQRNVFHSAQPRPRVPQASFFTYPDLVRYIQESFFTLHSHNHLGHSQAISCSRQFGIAARERLSAGAGAGKELAAGHSLLARQVPHKVHEVTREVVLLRSCDEAEHIDIAVLAVVKLPAGTCKRDSSDGAASRGNGTCAAEGSKPDHDLVLV